MGKARTRSLKMIDTTIAWRVQADTDFNYELLIINYFDKYIEMLAFCQILRELNYVIYLFLYWQTWRLDL